MPEYVWFAIWAMIVVVLVKSARKHTAQLEPWHCQRCMRHNNTKQLCELCDAPKGWPTKGTESGGAR